MRLMTALKPCCTVAVLLLALPCLASAATLPNTIESAAEQISDEADGPAMLLVAIHGDQQLISGLPRDIDITPPKSVAPHTWPGKATRWEWMDRANIGNSDGASATYSNLAFDLLSDALENASGIAYSTLVREHITAPLDMRDTTTSPNASQCARFIGNADAGPCVSTVANAGSGGLYSTASDIAKWMRHLLQVGTTGEDASLSLFEHMQILRGNLREVSGLDLAGHADGIGLGWVHLAASETSPEILQKTGGGGGFVNYIALAPTSRSGIFITFANMDVPLLQKTALAVNQALIGMSADQN